MMNRSPSIFSISYLQENSPRKNKILANYDHDPVFKFEEVRQLYLAKTKDIVGSIK